MMQGKNIGKCRAEARSSAKVWSGRAGRRRYGVSLGLGPSVVSMFLGTYVK